MSDPTTPAPATPAPAVPVAPPAPVAPAAAAPAAAATITIDDFKKVELRVGKVLECVKHPKADKLLILKMDMGDHTRQVCAGMAPYYPPEELVGKLVVICTNLAPRQLRGQESNGMMLAATDATNAERVIVLTVDKSVAPGSRIS